MRDPVELTASVASSAGSRLTPQRTRVLCVDDEPHILEGLRLQLGRRYEVLTATSAAAGLDILRRTPDIAVVVSDMRMPVMDGSAFLREVRALLPDCVRILLTGQADIDSAMAAINQGQVFRFLLKPCPPSALLAAVAAAAGQHRLLSAQRVLMEQSAQLSGQHDVRSALEAIFAKGCALFGCRYAALAWREHDTVEPRQVLAHGVPAGLFLDEGMSPPPLLAQLVEPGVFVYLQAAAGDAGGIEGLPPQHAPVAELIGLPIATATACYGWMYFAYGARQESFGPDDGQAALALASAAAQICEAEEARWSAQVRAERDDELAYLACYDALTGLPNRRQFVVHCGELLDAAHGSGESVVVLMLELARFKHLNDTLGRQTCDEILRRLADRLRELALQRGYVARVGGDRFAVVVPQQNATDLPALLASDLCDPLREPLAVGSRQLQLVGRLGLSVSPHDGESAEALLSNAEAAMKSAKSSGERLCVYTRELGATIARRMQLEDELRQAAREMRFAVHYQPQIDLRSGVVCGAEALLRWESPAFGPISPTQFVPILEDCGLIVDVGRWVLRQVVADCTAWRGQGLAPPLIAVNVSPLQLRRHDFVDIVREVVCGSGCASRCLALEITESALLDTAEDVIGKLHAVRALGVPISIDDFGTGYSALAYLAGLPVSALKIDRSFVLRLGESAQTTAVVTAIVSLAHALGLRVLAEGVDTLEQLRMLRELGCDELQGFLFSKALPAAAFADLLQQGCGLLLDRPTAGLQ